jgi:hypothetical protein
MSLIPKKSDIVFQHIYITSDEEIKEGDWCYQVELNDGKVDKCYDVTLYHTWTNNGVDKTRKFKKIILTTDPDLIQEGVQEIDDEFLEWFVKNPSCEFVEVKSFCKYGDNCPSQGAYDKQSLCDIGYKIVIPQEEPKKYPIGGYAPGNYRCTCVTCKTKFMGDKRAVQCEPCAIKMTQEEPKQKIIASEEDAKIFVEAIKNPPAPNEELKQAFKNFSKQEIIEDPDAYWLSPIKKEREWQEEKLKEIFEHYPNAAPRFQYLTGLIQIALKNIASKKSLETLEEAAKEQWGNVHRTGVLGFIEGAKWQAERMYSKEEVEKIVNRALTYGATASFKEWFEQFKKK